MNKFHSYIFAHLKSSVFKSYLTGFCCLLSLYCLPQLSTNFQIKTSDFTGKKRYYIFLKIKNHSDSTISFLRPDPKDIECNIISPSGGKNKLHIDNELIKALWKDTVYLKPHLIFLQPGCNYKLVLGFISFDEIGEDFRTENCNLFVNWNAASAFFTDNSGFLLEPGENGGQLITSLTSSQVNYKMSATVFLKVSIKNCEREPIEFKNEFYPYEKSRLQLIVKYKKNQESDWSDFKQGKNYAYLTSPIATNGYFVLLPQESLEVELKFRNLFTYKGYYKVQVSYSDRVKIGNKNKYIEKSMWFTNKLDLTIL